MPLASGSRFGAYEVLSLIGEGGMGQVYRARDTNLGRDVALKLLPEAVAADSERLARFEREARTLASLNHPHIAAIYGIERQGETRALVIEFVDGQDLSRVIARGAVPVAEATDISTQIASALESAHEFGIVHRDLKPANVMLRQDGTVKILDFGLAKGTGGTEGDGGHGATGAVANSPTMTAMGTQAGIILGTAGYMSPEQARGRAVDKRADIWAFGVVVWELLVGRRLFAGDDVSDVLASVLRQDVDFSALPADTPVNVRTLLERCLDRDLKTRLRDIGEARIALARGTNSGAMSTVVTAGASRSGVRASLTGGLTARELIAWVLLAVAAVPAAVVSGIWLSRPGTNSGGASADALLSTTVLTFVPPDDVVAEASRAIISPDGEKIVFSGRAPDGTRPLWLRRLGSVQVTRLPDTEEAIEPFWSPDSESIAFGAQGKLKAARQLFGDRNPIGQQIVAQDLKNRILAVVGVAPFVYARGPETSRRSSAYFAMPAQYRPSWVSFLLRTGPSAASVLPGVQDTFAAVAPPDPSPGAGARVVNDGFQRLTAARRFNASVMTVFGLVAVLIGAAGIYAVMASVVVQRTREIGIRVALGATSRHIHGDVLWTTGRHVLVGLAVGLPAGWWISRGFGAVFFQVAPSDAATYVIVTAIVTSVSLISTVVPARRAARVDPAITLRRT